MNIIPILIINTKKDMMNFQLYKTHEDNNEVIICQNKQQKRKKQNPKNYYMMQPVKLRHKSL